MWHPTQQDDKLQAAAAVVAATEVSGGTKKKKECSDCKCASAEFAATKSSCLAGDKCLKQNKFTQNSSNKDNKHLKLLKQREDDDEAIDSGFISGPQNNSSQIFQDDDEQSFHITDKQQQQPDKYSSKQQEATKPILDSGCIEADEFDDDADADDVGVAKFQLGERVLDELPKATVAAAAVATSSTTTTTTTSNAQMRLKSNVDSGMAERFCTLSLQAGAGTINNLNAASSRANTAPLNLAPNNNIQQATNKSQQQHQQQQQQQQSHANTTKTNVTTTRLSDWEEFYQQNSDGDTPLHLACLAGAEDVVVALLRIAVHPCLFNLQNDDAQTPLHMAALSAQPKILRMLLVAGAEPNIRDRHGNTALHVAVNSGEELCVRELITPVSPAEVQEAQRLFASHTGIKKPCYSLSATSLPSNLEIRNYNGERCVHLAAQEGFINILRTLVSYGADINAREGKSGLTPLHIAIENCNEKLVNYLLDECHNKLNLETETYAGLTAYQFACLMDKSQLQNVLEKFGAAPLTPPDSDYDSSDIEDMDDSKIFGDTNYFVSYTGANAKMQMGVA